MKWIGVSAASLVALAWSAAPVVFADEVAGQVTASIDVELGGCLVDFRVAAANRDSRESGERLTGRPAAFDAANAGSLAS